MGGDIAGKLPHLSTGKLPLSDSPAMRVKHRAMSDGLKERIEARLRELKLSERKASRLAGGSPDLIRGLLRKRQTDFRSQNLSKIAEVLGVSVEWLQKGGDLPQQLAVGRKISVVGYVGAGGQITIDGLIEGASLEQVACPFDELAQSTSAVRVRGDFLSPAYYDGDLIFYESSNHTNFTHLVGKECVVALADGRRFVKQLRQTQAGQWYLHSHNAEPILGIEIETAGKVKLIQRAE